MRPATCATDCRTRVLRRMHVAARDAARMPPTRRCRRCSRACAPSCSPRSRRPPASPAARRCATRRRAVRCAAAARCRGCAEPRCRALRSCRRRAARAARRAARRSSAPGRRSPTTGRRAALVAALKFRGALPVADLMAAQIAAGAPRGLLARRRARAGARCTRAAAARAASTRRRCSRAALARAHRPAARPCLRRGGAATRQLGAGRAARLARGRLACRVRGPVPARARARRRRPHDRRDARRLRPRAAGRRGASASSRSPTRVRCAALSLRRTTVETTVGACYDRGTIDPHDERGRHEHRDQGTQHAGHRRACGSTSRSASAKVASRSPSSPSSRSS